MTKIIDPWGSELPENYAKIVRDFGLEVHNYEVNQTRGDFFE